MSKKPSPKLPNTLTVIRLILAVIVIIIFLFPYDMIGYNFPKYLINGIAILDVKLAICAVLFIVASITDFFDGKIARKYNYVTNFGKLMDPVADKILVLSAILILIISGLVPFWTMLIVLLRELLVLGIRMLALQSDSSNVIAADIFGKIKTMTQMVSIILILLFAGISNYTEDTFIRVMSIVGLVLFYISIAFTLFSGAEILIKNRKMKEFKFKINGQEYAAVVEEQET